MLGSLQAPSSSVHCGIPGRPYAPGARPARVIPRAGKPNAGEPSYVPLEKEALIKHIAAGMKPRDKWRIGTEHEKFGFQQGTHERITYTQIEKVLQSLITRFGWQPMEEEGRIIGVTLDGQSVTLEPGGQFELSGAPVHTIQQTCAEVNNHLYQVKTISQELGIGFLGTGFDPKWSIKDIPLMPKDRYNLMTAYMPKVGTMGLDMMRRTCTVQVNLDYESEQDMIEKFRVGLALQPMANALFASSPFKDGKPTGCLSTRGFTWTDVDKARSGGLPFVFEPDMSFERYVDYAMDVPMYFVYRNGKYVDALGQSWRDFMAGKLPALPGQYPTVNDWENHLTTIFPEVRLKRYLEMRGADGGPWRMLCALPALWVGLLYEPQAQSEALAYIQDWTAEEREYLRVTAPRLGLRTPFRGVTVQDQAKVALAIARGGLQRRGLKEESFLERLEVIADTGLSQADHMLAMYETKWQRSVDPIYEEYAY